MFRSIKTDPLGIYDKGQRKLLYSRNQMDIGTLFFKTTEFQNSPFIHAFETNALLFIKIK